MSAIRLPLVALLVAGCASATPRPASAFVALGWTDNMGSMQIERRLNPGTYAPLVTLPPGVTAYTDTTVAPSTAYCYRARAVVGTSLSGYTAEQCGTTLPATTTPPPAPTPTGKVVTLTLTASGPGAGGTVASTPAGILATVPGTYRATFPEFSTVTLTETPKNNKSTFRGWSGGGCSGTARACAFKVIADTPIGAGFGR